MELDVKRILESETVVSEAMLVGLFWNKPDLYFTYRPEKIDYQNFNNAVYGFYFTLGRKAYDSGVKKFDDISMSTVVKDCNVQKEFDRYGGMETMIEIMVESKNKEENLDAYYSTVKKYSLLRNLNNLIGDKIFTNIGKYDYKKMTKEQIHLYWQDKVNSIGIDGDNIYESYDLLDDDELDKEVEEWNKNPDTGLPFFKSKKWTKICNGWAYGHMYILAAGSGTGKTSITASKILMSCLDEKEKTLVLANEQSIREFRKLMVITASGCVTKKPISRQRYDEGMFTEEEEKKVNDAKEWLKQAKGKQKDLIKFVFLESYDMNSVRKLINFYSARGYKNIIIDTGKPSEGHDSKRSRWEIMTEDFRELYKMCRPNGGGLNLRMWVTVQVTDTAANKRFLDETALGESKKIKNESSVLFLMRRIWDDEYAGGDREIKVVNYEKNALTGKMQPTETTLTRSEYHTYMLVFTAKNRRGKDKADQKVLVLKANLNSNTYEEVGWTLIFNDHKG